MKVVVAGGSGFIGQALVRRLLERGDDAAVLSRHPANVRAGRAVPWDATDEIAGADAVVNLAGENLGEGRWTETRKQRMLDSRIRPTAALVDAMRVHPVQRRTFISTSAVGYYGPRGGQVIDEMGQAGRGFLVEVTRRWEEEARQANDFSRLVIFRFGVVLGPDGGALQKMLLPFRLGVGGRVGSGDQWMSWIDRQDAVRAIEWAIDRREVQGTYNMTSPEPVTNEEFTKTLARVLHRPAILPVPAFALRAAFGEMADMLLTGQRVVPARATSEGFVFQYPTLESSLRHVLGR